MIGIAAAVGAALVAIVVSITTYSAVLPMGVGLCQL